MPHRARAEPPPTAHGAAERNGNRPSAPAAGLPSAARGKAPNERMFTSQRLRAVVPPGEVAVREQRIDDAVHQVAVRGSLRPEKVGEVARRLDGALASGARWLIVDLTDARPVADPMIAALLAAARECRARRGELIVAGAAPDVEARIRAHEVAHQPALAAGAEQALAILKLLRPRTRVPRAGAGARRRITPLTLRRIEPRTLN